MLNNIYCKIIFITIIEFFINDIIAQIFVKIFNY